MNQDFTVQKKAIFVWKKNSCRGFHLKKNSCTSSERKKKFVQAENSPPSPPHHFSNGPSLILNLTKDFKNILSLWHLCYKYKCFFVILVIIAGWWIRRKRSGKFIVGSVANLSCSVDFMHQSIPPAPSPPPPGLLRGICTPCQSRGWGICKVCTARGPGICQPPGHSRAFDTHAVSYQNITT